MTPLAQAIARELTLPIAKRTFLDDSGVLDVIADVHCFDVTEVWEAANVIAANLDALHHAQTGLGFLPAPLTWIESRNFLDNDGKGRVGFLLEMQDNGGAATCLVSIGLGQHFRSMEKLCFSLPLGLAAPAGRIVASARAQQHEMKTIVDLGRVVLSYLALINTPQIIGRRQHMPHAGLQRDIARAKGMVGKYPLRAWTEIKLEVTPPRIDEGGVHEARLSGAKALHFCRQHLRIRNGRLERVRAHWRGDPAIGIKRSRYKLVAPPTEPTHRAP